MCAHCPRAQPGPPNRRPVRQFTWFLFLRASIYGARCCRKKCSRVRQPGPAQHHEGLQRRGQSQEPGGAPESSDLRNAAGVKQETCWLVPTALPVLRPRGWAQSWPRGDTGGRPSAGQRPQVPGVGGEALRGEGHRGAGRHPRLLEVLLEGLHQAFLGVGRTQDHVSARAGPSPGW